MTELVGHIHSVVAPLPLKVPLQEIEMQYFWPLHPCPVILYIKQDLAILS